MRILSVGKISTENQHRQECLCYTGVTLVEMMVVVAIMSLMVGISFPAISSGVDSLRLNAASNGVVDFFNAGLNRAERRQQVVEIRISRPQNTLAMYSTERGFSRTFELPAGIAIARILPDLPDAPDVRSFMLYPGGSVPRFGLQLVNRRNAARIVRVDPITGVPQVERAEQ